MQHMLHHQRGAGHDHGHGAAHGESQGDAEQKARAAQKLKQADLLRRTNGLPRVSDLLACREHRHRRQSEYAEDAYDEIGACVVDGEQSLAAHVASNGPTIAAMTPADSTTDTARSFVSGLRSAAA